MKPWITRYLIIESRSPWIVRISFNIFHFNSLINRVNRSFDFLTLNKKPSKIHNPSQILFHDHESENHNNFITDKSPLSNSEDLRSSKVKEAIFYTTDFKPKVKVDKIFCLDGTSGLLITSV